MKDRIRVLIIGSGFSAGLHLSGYVRLGGKVEIAGICSKAPEQIKALAEQYGLSGYEAFDDYQQAIDSVDCDLVDICVPNFLHHPVCMKALEKGRHVLCEKPLATNAEHAREMVDTARAKGLHIYYGEDWIFAPAIMRALEIVEEGALGKIAYMRARECHSGSHSPYNQTIAMCGGGAMINLGIHPIGLMMAIKNHKWTSVTAFGTGGKEQNVQHKSLEGEDLSGCFVTFEDGSSALLEANYVTTGGMEDVVDFYGDKGCIHLNLNQEGPIACFSVPGLAYTVEKAEVTTGWSHPAYDEMYTLGYTGEIAHFVECCRKGEPARIGLRGEDGLASLELLACIYQSMREGRKIDNPRGGSAK